MTTRTAIIASSVGLHARPASLFVQKVTRSGLPVTIARPGQSHSLKNTGRRPLRFINFIGQLQSTTPAAPAAR